METLLRIDIIPSEEKGEYYCDITPNLCLTLPQEKGEYTVIKDNLAPNVAIILARTARESGFDVLVFPV